MNVVLVEPEIPQNVGNIARTCVLTGTPLHLVRPLGFSLEDRYLKRAGLDYWPYLSLYLYDSFEEFEIKHGGERFIPSTIRGKNFYHQMYYQKEDFLLFGKETKGLDPDIIAQYKDNSIRVPMTGPPRSLNLSNTVAVVLYEALRQQGFPGLK